MADDFTKVATLSQVPPGSMIGVRYDGEEVVLANVEGTVYANPPAHPRCRCWLRPEVVR